MHHRLATATARTPGSHRSRSGPGPRRPARLSFLHVLLSVTSVLSVPLALAPPTLRAATPYDSARSGTGTGPIDRCIQARLTRAGVTPANLCSDATFVRRVHLDVIGTLPTWLEARDFIQDGRPAKRAALIDRLLERDEFADYWAMKWCDLLRVKAEFPINLWPNAAQAYHRWIHTALREHQPYDQFVRALLTSSGSNFREPPVNFYRALQNRTPEGLAQAVALTFMGTRLERWPAPQQADLADFFRHVAYKTTAEWKEEIVLFASRNGTNTLPRDTRFPDGTAVRLTPERDPRTVFADWLLQPDNPWFARNLVNRTWSWLLGRGIVQEPDDLRPDNPPSHPELLATLEQEFIRSGYDVRHLCRIILNSDAYQRACVPPTGTPPPPESFAVYPLRRLDAEVLIDALCQITGAGEAYTSPIPEPFTFIPEGTRAITLADGSINSPFLELFGRPARDTGLESERQSKPAAAQRLHLLNSSHIQRKLESSRLVQHQAQPGQPPRDVANALFLTILSRFPTPAELEIVERHLAAQSSRRDATLDLVWALINSTEFQYRH